MAKKENIEYEFNPIKQSKDGKEAERVIWSTKSLNAAVDALKKGLPLKANPFIGKVTALLKPDLVYKRTKEEIEDYLKCKKDPVYFAAKCFLKNPEGGLSHVEMRDYQIDYLRHLQKNRFSILLSCRQAGKSVTTAIYCLWVILFNTDKTGLILSKSGPAGRDLLSKIKDMYIYLPYHLKIGTMKWNQTEISFDNNSTISTEPFSPTAGLGKTINFLILDEFAWCPPNEVDLFYNNIIPTISADPYANVCIMSTQNGFNLFYKLWKGAVEKTNIYAPFKVDWNQVPEWNKETGKWIKRDNKWKDKMVGILGSEEAFYYQYGTQFSASDKCLVSRNCLARLRDKTILFEHDNDLPVSLQYKEHLYWKPGYHYSPDDWYIILVDLAEGGGGDFTVFNILKVIDKDKFEQVGYWRSNKVDLEKAALDFWLMTGQLFNNDHCIWSIEWNTYGALFYTYLIMLNENDMFMESLWRFNICNDGIDIMNIVFYKKQSLEDSIINKFQNSKNIPGIRLTSSNKITGCSLLKMMFEKEDLITNDLLTVGELENFEDKNGNGSYKAAYGHDDVIMTFVQLPMLKQTARYKDFISEYVTYHDNNNINNLNTNYDNLSLYGPVTPQLPLFGNIPDNVFNNSTMFENTEHIKHIEQVFKQVY